MEDDLLELLGSDEKPFQSKETNTTTERKPYTGGNDKPKQENYWDKEDIAPVKIDASKFSKSEKTYSVCVYVGNEKLPSDVKEKIIEISKVLLTKGYKFRHYGSADDELQNAIIDIEIGSKETYIPWKKFNPNITKPILSLGTGTAYGIGLDNHKVFMKLPAPVRAVLANNVHVMLGKDCNDPLDLLISYTKCGSEHLTKKMDYKLTGSLTFFLSVCGESNIPVFNIKNEDCIKRISDFLKK